MIIKRYVLAVCILLIILYFHAQAMFNGWYYIQYFDIWMHIAGGIGIATFCYAILGKKTHDMTFSKVALSIIFGTILFGLLWEAFEIIEDASGFPLWTKPYYIDTIKDIFDDIIGSVIFVFIFRKWLRKA